jgi:hypothetical protein
MTGTEALVALLLVGWLLLAFWRQVLLLLLTVVLAVFVLGLGEAWAMVAR